MSDAGEERGIGRGATPSRPKSGRGTTPSLPEMTASRPERREVCNADD